MTIIATGAVVPSPAPSFPARRSGAADSGFSVPGSGSAQGHAGTSQVRDASPVVDAGAILALQEDAGQDAGGAAEMADRQARRHGQDLLAALAALQKELLEGGDPALSLSRLSTLADMTSTAHDPGLARVMAAIRLRARLEILRLARGSSEASLVQEAAGITPSVTGR